MKTCMRLPPLKARYPENQKHADNPVTNSGTRQKAAKAKALEYMTAVIRTVAPLLTKEQSQKKLQNCSPQAIVTLLRRTEGAIRYVVADNGEKGLTFAVEPIKLALSENLEGVEIP